MGSGNSTPYFWWGDWTKQPNSDIRLDINNGRTLPLDEHKSSGFDLTSNEISIEQHLNHSKAGKLVEQFNNSDSVAMFYTPDSKQGQGWYRSPRELSYSAYQSQMSTRRRDAEFLDKAIRMSLDKSGIKDKRSAYEQKAQLGVLSKVKHPKEYDQDLVLYNTAQKSLEMSTPEKKGVNGSPNEYTLNNFETSQYLNSNPTNRLNEGEVTQEFNSTQGKFLLLFLDSKLVYSLRTYGWTNLVS